MIRYCVALTFVLFFGSSASAQESQPSEIQIVRDEDDLFTLKFSSVEEQLPTVFATSGSAIDTEVLERILRDRVGDVTERALHDLMDLALASWGDARPLRDFVDTALRGFLSKSASEEPLSQALFSSLIRVGLSFSVEELIKKGNLSDRGCMETGDSKEALVKSMVMRTNAVYEGLSRSIYLAPLGFPEGKGFARPQCALLAADVARLVDTIAAFGLNADELKTLLDDLKTVKDAAVKVESGSLKDQFKTKFPELSTLLGAVSADREELRKISIQTIRGLYDLSSSAKESIADEMQNTFGPKISGLDGLLVALSTFEKHYKNSTLAKLSIEFNEATAPTVGELLSNLRVIRSRMVDGLLSGAKKRIEKKVRSLITNQDAVVGELITFVNTTFPKELTAPPISKFTNAIESSKKALRFELISLMGEGSAAEIDGWISQLGEPTVLEKAFLEFGKVRRDSASRDFLETLFEVGFFDSYYWMMEYFFAEGFLMDGSSLVEMQPKVVRAILLLPQSLRESLPQRIKTLTDAGCLGETPPATCTTDLTVFASEFGFAVSGVKSKIEEDFNAKFEEETKDKKSRLADEVNAKFAELGAISRRISKAGANRTMRLALLEFTKGYSLGTTKLSDEAKGALMQIFLRQAFFEFLRDATRAKLTNLYDKLDTSNELIDTAKSLAVEVPAFLNQNMSLFKRLVGALAKRAPLQRGDLLSLGKLVEEGVATAMSWRDGSRVIPELQVIGDKSKREAINDREKALEDKINEIKAKKFAAAEEKEMIRKAEELAEREIKGLRIAYGEKRCDGRADLLESMCIIRGDDEKKREELQAIFAAFFDTFARSLEEDPASTIGYRVDGPQLASVLTAVYNQSQGAGYYLRASIGSGYVATSSGVNPAFYEEIGVGYRSEPVKQKIMVGGHLIASGLAFALNDKSNQLKPGDLFFGAGGSINFYRMLDVSANGGILVGGGSGVSPMFTLGLQIPISDYLAALAQGSGVQAQPIAKKRGQR